MAHRNPGSHEVFALVPDETGGVSIAAVGDITGRLDEGESYDDALTNAAIDSFYRPSADELAAQVERVRQLNLTGDGKAFWGMS